MCFDWVCWQSFIAYFFFVILSIFQHSKFFAANIITQTQIDVILKCLINYFCRKNVWFNHWHFLGKEGSKIHTSVFSAYIQITSILVCIRCLMGSTDQADSNCFYFRISWMLMERHCFYCFLFPWSKPQR